MPDLGIWLRNVSTVWLTNRTVTTRDHLATETVKNIVMLLLKQHWTLRRFEHLSLGESLLALGSQ